MNWFFVGAKSSIVLTSLILLGLSVGAVFTGLVPGFTDDTSRAVNVSPYPSYNICWSVVENLCM